MKVKDLVVTALFAALTAAGAQVSLLIPAMGPVPFTLQDFVVVLSGAVLGAKLGALSQIVYLLTGAIGLPVFAGGTGGLGHIAGPTGGYLISYPLAAYLTGILAGTGAPVPRSNGRGLVDYGRVLAAMLAGTAVVFILGVGQLWLYLRAKQGAGVSLSIAVAKGLLPFIVPDLVKMIAAAGIAQKVRRAVPEAVLRTGRVS